MRKKILLAAILAVMVCLSCESVIKVVDCLSNPLEGWKVPLIVVTSNDGEIPGGGPPTGPPGTPG